MKDPTDRLIWYLILGAVFAGAGALLGSIPGAGGAPLGAFCGLVLLFSLYLQYRGPF